MHDNVPVHLMRFVHSGYVPLVAAAPAVVAVVVSSHQEECRIAQQDTGRQQKVSINIKLVATQAQRDDPFQYVYMKAHVHAILHK